MTARGAQDPSGHAPRVANGMSYRLYADLGNCTLHLGLWRGGWALERRVAVAEIDAAGAWAEAVRAALHDARLGPDDCAGALAVASAPRSEKLAGAVRGECGIALRLVGADVPVPMPVAYDDPSALGQDRRLAACGAARIAGAPCIVLDAGTCITCDAVSADGALLPVGISPGLPALTAGLRAATPHLATALDEALARDLALPAAPARSTADSIAAGLAASVTGTGERLVNAARRALGAADAPLVVTGGDGPLVATGLSQPVTLLPMLTLDALRMLDEAEGA